MKVLERRIGDKVLYVRVDSEDPGVVAYAQNQLDTYEERQERARLNAIRRGRIERLLMDLRAIDTKILDTARHYAPYWSQPFIDDYSAFITSTQAPGGVVLGLINQKEQTLIHELRGLVPIDLYEQKKNLERKLEGMR